MNEAPATRLKVVAFGALLAALGLGLFFIAATELLNVMEDWGAPRLFFGSNLLAMPGFGFVCLAMAVIFVRAAMQGKAPIELMSAWIKPSLAVAAASVLLAIVGGTMISERLTADGYTRCEQLGYPGRMSSGFWAKSADACDDRPSVR